MQEETRTDLGKVRIHKKVIASISSIASLEIEGVAKMGGSLKSSISEILGNKGTDGIDVAIDKDNEAKIDVPIVIKYGYNIPEVSQKVQDNIRNALEKMINISIKEINIDVQSIERGR